MKRYISILIFLCIFFTACDQEPLFWDISQEYPPIEPVIKGSPSRIVYDGTNLYVSNGDIWECDLNKKPPTWGKYLSSGSIKAVAAGGGALFSLDWSGTIKKRDASVAGGWVQISVPNGHTEQIFVAGSTLFAGARTGTAGAKDGYCIYQMSTSGSTSMTLLKSGTGLLSGAAGYYLGTMGDGIYDTTSSNPVTGTEGLNIRGITEHAGEIVAVAAGGRIISSAGGAITISTYSLVFSGAIASWSDGTDSLLLLGIQSKSGSFGYGYQERNSAGSFSIPGQNKPSSVARGSEYTSAIGNHGVTSLYVLPSSVSYTADSDGRPVIYASTVKNGLWSYRIRNSGETGGKPQWNGEDNSN